MSESHNYCDFPTGNCVNSQEFHNQIESITRKYNLVMAVLERIKNTPSQDSSGLINNENNWTRWARKIAGETFTTQSIVGNGL